MLVRSLVTFASGLSSLPRFHSSISVHATSRSLNSSMDNANASWTWGK